MKVLLKLQENSSKMEIKPPPLCAIPHENQSQPQIPRERPQARNEPLPPCCTQNQSHPARLKPPDQDLPPRPPPSPKTAGESRGPFPFLSTTSLTLHKKRSPPLRISSVKVIRYAAALYPGFNFTPTNCWFELASTINPILQTHRLTKWANNPK